jgi:predicted nucleotidyltransferase
LHDDARPDSDVDVFVEAASDERFGFRQFMDAYQAPRKSVGEDVDLGYSTRAGLSPFSREAIEQEAIRVF